MTRQYLPLAGAGALALGILGLIAATGRSADDEKIIIPKDIATAVNKMADQAYKGEDLKKPAEAFFKKHPDDLKKAMWAFKPRKGNGEGGFGVGAKPDPTSTVPDGLEAWILTYGNPKHKAMTPKELMKAAPDIERLADVTVALAAIAHQYTPKKKEGDKDPKDWKESNDQMKEWAQKLKAAAKGNDPDKVKAAFTKLYSSCNNCHSVFRD